MTDEIQVTAPFDATVIAIAHEPDERIGPGEALLVLEAMKMEHEIVAEHGGVVQRVDVTVGDTVREGQLLAVVTRGPSADGAVEPEPEPTESREDLDAVLERHALTRDESRPDAVAKRHELGRRTAREN